MTLVMKRTTAVNEIGLIADRAAGIVTREYGIYETRRT